MLNTCHIREHASEKVYSELGRLRDAKLERRAEGRDLTIAVAGCVAQAEGEEIVRRQPAVDIVVGPQAYHRLPELLAEAERKAAFRRAGKRLPGAGVLDTDFPAESKFDHLPAPQGVRAGSAFLSIQEGCDKFCTFCVVPYTRGAEYSRPAAAVLAEARHLVAAGAIEITLLGQNVNAYHGEAADGSTWSLARLIRALAEIDGVARIRYTTSHPRDMDDELIAAHGEVPQLMPYLHLPVQSGSDRILEAMNRRHWPRSLPAPGRSPARRAARSRAVVRFHRRLPGRERRRFRRHDAADRRGGLRLGLFLQVQPPARHAGLGDAGSGAGEREGGAAGRPAGPARPARRAPSTPPRSAPPCRCCSPRPGRKPGQIIGKTPWLQSVYAEGNPRLIGRIVDVRLTEGHANSLAGEIVVRSWEAAA